jgi:phosphoribosylformylglycinamidine cyclo-ligase
MEVYTDKQSAEEMIKISKEYGIDAQIIGYCEAFNGKKLTIRSPYGEFIY